MQVDYCDDKVVNFVKLSVILHKLPSGVKPELLSEGRQIALSPIGGYRNLHDKLSFATMTVFSKLLST